MSRHTDPVGIYTKAQRRENARERACELLEEWDIDPLTVPLNGLTHDTYEEIVFDKYGQPFARPDGSVAHYPMPWPTGFPVAEFFEYMHEMEGAVL